MALKDQNPNHPDPMATYIAYFAAMLGIASCLTLMSSIGITLTAAPCAIGFGLWARHKGARSWAMWVGIAAGCISLTILGFLLYNQLSQLNIQGS